MKMNPYDRRPLRQLPAGEGSTLPAMTSERHPSARVEDVHAHTQPSLSEKPTASDRPSQTGAPQPSATRDNRRTLRMALLCVLLAAGAAAVLLPTLRSASGNGDRSPGDVLGGVILDGGLPPVGDPPSGISPEDTYGDTLPADMESADSLLPAPSDSETDRTDPESVETAPEALPPAETAKEETVPESEAQTAETESVIETVLEESAPVDTAESEPPLSEIETEADSLPADTAPSETSPFESAPSESDPPATPPEETEETETPESSLPETDPPETDPPPPETMPDGAFPVVRVDLSEPDRSVGYIHSTADRLPPSIPGEDTRLWSTAGAPSVLIVHTHPYEGYHDGSAWYDPADGSFAQTDTLGDPYGVVAMGASLTRLLREAGVTVIHLRVPVGEGESAAVTYARTEETVRYYCELYPDIGLVLDLRRSAELSDTGEILRTTGSYEGETCAQLRLSVNGDRDTAAVSRDIAVAVALRRALWAKEPTLSRPVWVKSGSGPAGEISRVAMLTVELGSAGNSFAEAERLLSPLGEVIAALIQK